MTYVFGINLPLNELLLLVLIFQAACFIMMLVELFKLRRLLNQERYDLNRFEQDLGTLEKRGEHKTAEPSTALQDYVQRALAKGIPASEVRKKLEDRGWHADQIDKVLPGVLGDPSGTLNASSLASSPDDQTSESTGEEAGVDEQTR